MFKDIFHKLLLAAGLWGALSSMALAGQVEVLHWWTSPGEQAAVEVLKERVDSSQQEWKDFAVAGGGGGNAMTVLKSRVLSGNPPSAAQIRGVGIQEWAGLGLLTDIDEVARAQDWDTSLPGVVSSTMKYKGQYVAAPVNIHRTNWLWVNPKAFRKTGLAILGSWDELFAVAPELRKAGYIPLAHGGDPWQASTIFESVVLSIGGAEFYRRAFAVKIILPLCFSCLRVAQNAFLSLWAFVEKDQKALKSDIMVKVFETMAKIRKLFDEGSSKRSWDQATELVIEDKAAMQLMGDWAKGEFFRKGKKAGDDYLCLPAPGTDNSFVYNIDSFVMFNLPEDSKRDAQKMLAKLLMDPYFQLRFNRYKGSIPARSDIPTELLDSCARKSREAFAASVAAGTLVPGITHGMVLSESVQNDVIKVVSLFLNTGGADIQAAINNLAGALQAKRYVLVGGWKNSRQAATRGYP